MAEYPEYSVAIRTLGTAGEKFQTLLNSIDTQSIQPQKIVVYIAEGYNIPQETIGKECYVFVKKGMVAQRALRYDEIETEYILFLDDDLYLPPDTVKEMFDILEKYNADVISPDIYPNSERNFLGQVTMALSGRMLARRDDSKWGYKVMRTAGYSYNKNPQKTAYLSQTNAGACFLCTKDNFLKIRFEEEKWMDKVKYALGDDQTMYFKMYKYGLKQLTWYNNGLIHLDGGGASRNTDKERAIIYSDFRFKTIFWHRFIYLPDKSLLSRLWSIACISYALIFTLMVSLLKLNFKLARIKSNAIHDGIKYIKSQEYKSIPLINQH